MISTIKYYNRYTGEMENETAPAESFLKWLYYSKSGKILSPLFTGKFFSNYYGKKQKSGNASVIKDFVERNKTNLDDFHNGDGDSSIDGYKDFGHFFLRDFIDGKRFT